MYIVLCKVIGQRLTFERLGAVPVFNGDIDGVRPPFWNRGKGKTGTSLTYKMATRDLRSFVARRYSAIRRTLSLDHIWGQQAISLRKNAAPYSRKTTVNPICSTANYPVSN